MYDLNNHGCGFDSGEGIEREDWGWEGPRQFSSSGTEADLRWENPAGWYAHQGVQNRREELRGGDGVKGQSSEM